MIDYGRLEEEVNWRRALLEVLGGIKDELRLTRELQTEEIQEAMFHEILERMKMEGAASGIIVPRPGPINLAER